MKDVEAPIVDVFCKKCGTHTTTLAPMRIDESYDYQTGYYTFVDATECGACGNLVYIQRKMKVIEQISFEREKVKE